MKMLKFFAVIGSMFLPAISALSVSNGQDRNAKDIKSPKAIELPKEFEFESPLFIGESNKLDDELVETALLNMESAHSDHQKLLKNIKGMAWANTVSDREEGGYVHLVEFVFANSPRRIKEFHSYPSLEVQPWSNLKKSEFKRLLYYLGTPEMRVNADAFIQRKGIESVRIESQSKGASPTRFEFGRLVYGYSGTPEEMFRKLLANHQDEKFVIQIHSSQEFVDISFRRSSWSRGRHERWVFDLAKHGQLIYYENLAAPSVCMTVENTFEKQGDLWLPKKTVRKKFNLRSRKWTKIVELNFFDLEANVEIPSGEFSISSLPIGDDIRISDKRTGRIQYFYLRELLQQD